MRFVVQHRLGAIRETHSIRMLAIAGRTYYHSDRSCWVNRFPVGPLYLLKCNDLGAHRIDEVRAVVDAVFHSGFGPINRPMK